MQKAAVLPVPVCAWPIKSMPFSALGISPAWMGVGSRYSASWSEASMTFESPIAAKPEDGATGDFTVVAGLVVGADLAAVAGLAAGADLAVGAGFASVAGLAAVADFGAGVAFARGGRGRAGGFAVGAATGGGTSVVTAAVVAGVASAAVAGFADAGLRLRCLRRFGRGAEFASSFSTASSFSFVKIFRYRSLVG